MEFWCFGDGTCSRIQDKLQTISLSGRKIKKKRVAVVYFGMNERSGDSAGSRMINCITDTSQITDIKKTRFRNQGDVLSKSEIFVKDGTEIASTVNR